MSDRWRERLGRIVRDTWVAAVRELVPNPKPSWLEPWETLTDEFQREVDMRIGEALARHFAANRPEPEPANRCITCGRTQSAEDWDLAAHARILQFERDQARIELATHQHQCERLPGREWRAVVDGETVFSVIGPDAEAMVRSVPGALRSYREPQKPTAENGWQLNGPWIGVE